MEQVRLCTVCPMKNWLGTSKTTYRVGWMIWIWYSHALERRCLILAVVAPFIQRPTLPSRHRTYQFSYGREGGRETEEYTTQYAYARKNNLNSLCHILLLENWNKLFARRRRPNSGHAFSSHVIFLTTGSRGHKYGTGQTKWHQRHLAKFLIPST